MLRQCVGARKVSRGKVKGHSRARAFKNMEWGESSGVNALWRGKKDVETMSG